jgi:hypothetical protein
MNFSFRKIKPSDYDDLLVGWWQDWGWTPPDEMFLPTTSEDEYSGYIVEVDGEPLCAGFFYLTNSPVGWVEWVISKKEKSEARSRALDELLSLLTDTLVASGCAFAYASIKHANLIKRYENIGYIQGDAGMTEMIKAL